MLLKLLGRAGILAALVVVCQGTWALAASTTGALTGYVLVDTGAPVADATVSVTAPSEANSTKSDTAGHFAFVSLIPDTYTVTAAKEGYTTITRSGITVLADNTRTITITTQAVKTLGVVTTRAVGELVKPGTTSDVYSINPTVQAKVANLGGGGSLNQAYSALASTPGVVVPPGQMGWFQTIHIRGGDYDQVGYEFDGVPVLRSYDNYPTTTASTLGQQELQVYTGAAPTDSQGQGLAGYINQVIKAGTYPGFSNLSLGIGAPTLYNSGSIEVGGATPDRNFSYYIASTNTAQDFRYIDQNNGASYQSTFGTPFANLPCPGNATNLNFRSCYASGIGPGGLALAPPIDAVDVSNVYDRENLVNLHFGLPHRNDSGKDDIQLLYDVSYLNNKYYSSASDWGFSDPAFAALNGSQNYQYFAGNFGLGIQYLGAVGAPLASNYQAMTHPVYFAYNPNSIANGPAFIPFNQRDGTANPNSIIKAQYQHNIGSSAYLRVYGFSDYSEWPQTCPITLDTNFVGYCPLNYYVRQNQQGGSLSYGDQINDKNLITFDLNDIAGIDYRANDVTMINQLEGLSNFAYATSSANPTAGICYSNGSAGAPPAGTAISCHSAFAQTFTLGQALAGAPLPAPNCGGPACEWFVAENGQIGGGNYAKPNFANVGIRDQWKPTSQLFIDAGLREDRFSYQLSNTAATAARPFWFAAWNNSYCALPGGGNKPFYNVADDTAANSPCPLVNGIQSVPATLTNLPNDSETFYIFQPRLGATFTANQDNVIRFSAGRYDQAPNTAFEQYNLLNQDLPSYDGKNFYAYGFNTTTHAIYPPTSDNFDLSWEHHFAGTEASFKLTPYYRKTHNQIQNFFLDQKTNFVSGLNVGNQTGEGVEFQLNLGNFNENGLSALLAYTYNHSYISFSKLGNGGTVLDSINISIQQYNSFTSGCNGAAPNSSTTSRCGSFGNANAFPCYTTAGVGAPVCAAGDVANPYWNAPAQPTLDPSANYIPFSTIPGGIEAASASYETPNVASLVLNFKHDKWAISPQFQFFEGTYYGDPLSGYGVNPAACTATLASPISGDPRYPYGAPGGSPFDATTCGATNPANGLGIAIPDPFTKQFDSLGAFRAPNQFLMHAQVSYIASPRMTFTIGAANIINSCSGGTAEPWTRLATKAVCGAYLLPGYSAPVKYGANIYNPGATFEPEIQYPYQENPIAAPLQAVFQVKISL